MKKTDTTDRLLAYLEGRLSAAEATALEADLRGSPALRQQYQELKHIRETLRAGIEATRPAAVRPFLADRVMRRIQASPSRPPAWEDLLAPLLVRVFRPFATLALFLILALALYNVTSRDDSVFQSPTEAVFGLPPVTFATAYELDL